MRRATGFRYFYIIKITISIHALLAESDSAELRMFQVDKISIHALLAESDALDWFSSGGACDFYPRSPCGERLRQRLIEFGKFRFLSTLSLRRATRLFFIIFNLFRFLSTLSLRRATGQATNTRQERQISIHALLAESDCVVSVQVRGDVYFYPRSPCGERPPRGGSCYLDNIISIHALLAESDVLQS